MSNSLLNLLLKSELDTFCAKLLNTKKNKLCMRSPCLRLDPPNDIKNTYGWHQDSAYNNYNKDGTNALLLWCPLVDVDENNGTLRLIKQSHKLGTLKTTNLKKKDVITKQKIVPKKYVIKNKNETFIKASSGDVLIAYTNIIHASGYNSSNKVRITTRVNIHDMSDKNFYYNPKRFINEKKRRYGS